MQNDYFVALEPVPVKTEENDVSPGNYCEVPLAVQPKIGPLRSKLPSKMNSIGGRHSRQILKTVTDQTNVMSSIDSLQKTKLEPNDKG